MIEQDIFVGIVAVLTGLFVVASVAMNTGWVNRFWLSRHLENSSNDIVSRAVLVAIGLLCTLLGVLLLMGFFPSEARRGSGTGNSNGDMTPGRLSPAID